MASRSLVSMLVEPRVVCQPRTLRSPANLSVTEFARLSPRDLSPVRRGIPRRGSRSFVGFWWFASTGAHVGFGSLRERDVLMALDFEGDVVEVERDPVEILRPRGERTPVPCPWLFVRRCDGSRVLVVHATAAGVATLAHAFEGTEVSVASPGLPDPAQLKTIRWLAGFRFSRCRPPVDLEREVLEMCVDGRRIADVSGYLSERMKDLDLARIGTYALIWHRLLVLADRDSPLSEMSVVVAR